MSMNTVVFLSNLLCLACLIWNGHSLVKARRAETIWRDRSLDLIQSLTDAAAIMTADQRQALVDKMFPPMKDAIIASGQTGSGVLSGGIIGGAAGLGSIPDAEKKR